MAMHDDHNENFQEDGVTEVKPLRATSEYRPLGKDKDKGVVIVLVGSMAGRTFPVSGEAMIGRSAEAAIPIPSSDVSRQHALIRAGDQGEFIIQDLQSRNGTLVNGIPIQEQVLQFGDKILIGTEVVLLFSRYDGLEDQLLQSQRLETIGQLAGGIAHDFNNILGAGLANVAFLKGLSPGTTLESAEIRDCLEDLDTALQRAVELTRQLLGLARRDRREELTVSVSKVVREVINLIKRTFPASISIEPDLAPDLTIAGDSSQLHQMVMNLCVNARDAMSEGGTLSIAARSTRIDAGEVEGVAPGIFVQLKVSDTGVGMDERTRRSIFEPFFTTKARGKGTGIGLSTVKQIVKHHGGAIRVDSTPGRGSEFTILLPAIEEARQQPMVAGPMMTRRVASGMILLVDDDEVFLNSARRLIEGMGYGVLSARGGREAISTYQQHKELIHLVLLDLNMPEVDGVEVFETLQKMEPSVKVLISSGKTVLGEVRSLLASGARGFLQKPYDVGTLSAALTRALFG